MTLPEYITNFFSKMTLGFLDPIISGLYSIFPAFIILGIIFGVVGLFFRGTRGAAAVSLVICLILCGVFPSMGEFLSSIFSWFGSSIDMSSATSAAEEGLSSGMSNIQGL